MENVVRGLKELGADVLDLGMVTTPMVGFTVAKHKLAGGVVITASHGPKKDSGIKLLAEQAYQLGK